MFATAVCPEPREIKLHDHFQREAFAPDQATIRVTGTRDSGRGRC